MDADGWRRILCSNNFGNSNVDLRKAIANFIKKLCTESISTVSIEAFVACRLIPLDKNPGLRPIGVGEILRRITGKVIVSILKKEVVSSAGSLQVCAGQEAGSEAAIHAMENIFKEESTEAVLLVDATNAFNSINRKVFLHNISILCPAISTFVTNCYTSPARLFVIGGTEIRSNEGTTQGDPVAMAIYALGITPLITMLIELVSPNCSDLKMVAFADDFSAAGKLKSLLQWWQTLLRIGPKFGYYPEPTKSWLITKFETYAAGTETFKGTNLKITPSGKRYLGSVLGTTVFKKEYINNKVTQWIAEIEILSQIAKIEPQAAYCCFTTGFKHKITYIMRTTPNIKEELLRLDETISNKFIPSIIENKICGNNERHLLSLPTKLGGMGIPIFSEISENEYQNSSRLTKEHVSLILRQERSYEIQHESLNDIKKKIKQERQKYHQEKLVTIRSKMTREQCRLNDINVEQGASTWLTTLPLEDEGYMLNKQEFWDLINIRYGWPLSRTPATCACGSHFNIQHALSCKKGGFITLRHNRLRNITANLLKEVCHDVRIEPTLQRLTGEEFEQRTANTSDDARLDVAARGFWTAGQIAFFDLRVFYSNATRYANQSLQQCYASNETEKKRKYNSRVLNVEQGCFTPLVFSANGGMGRECKKFYARLAEMIAGKRKEEYCITMSWLRRKLSFSLMKSILLCVRGSRGRKSNDVNVTENIEMSEYQSSINEH